MKKLIVKAQRNNKKTQDEMGLNDLLSSFGELIKGSRWRHHSKW